MKIAIYTAIFGDKDDLKEPINYKFCDQIDYFLITDNRDINSECYKILHKQAVYDDVTKNARYYKVIGIEEFKNYDCIIWHDANLQIFHNKISNLAELSKHSEIAFFKHSDRSF